MMLHVNRYYHLKKLKKLKNHVDKNGKIYIFFFIKMYFYYVPILLYFTRQKIRICALRWYKYEMSVLKKSSCT